MHTVDQVEIIRSLVRAAELLAPSLTEDVDEQAALVALLHVIDGKLVELAGPAPTA